MKQRVIDFLMGKQPQTAEVNPTSTYGADVDNFINALREQPYMQKLYNAPIQERLSDEQIAEKVANGLNLGIPELAQAQKDVGIRIPQGTEQVAQAQLGEFNKPMVVAGVNNAPREGGLIQGYKQGYNLNYDNPTNTVGTRIGQALGSIGRFADSSLGRGLIAYGLSNAMGDTNPLEQAFTAGVGRQTAVTKDKAYRQNLKQMAKQLEMDESEIDNIRGNITDEMYENMISSMKQIEDTKYRQLYLDTQNKNQAGLNLYRMASLAQEAEQNNFKNMIDRQKLAIELKKLEKGDPVSINNVFALANHFDTLPEVKNFKEIDRQFANVNETYKAYKNGQLKANAADQAMVTTLNKILDPTSVVRESEFARTAAGQSAFNRMQGYLDKLTKGGGGLTNREREDLFNTMKIMRNSAYSTYSNTAQTYTEMANRYGMNPDDIIRYRSSYTDTENNMQTVKMRNPKTGKIYNVPLQDVEEMQLKGGEIVNG